MSLSKEKRVSIHDQDSIFFDEQVYVGKMKQNNQMEKKYAT